MKMRFTALTALTMLALAACKPPATDEMATGAMAQTSPDAPPAPLESPDSEGAIWADSQTQERIIYGQPGKAPLMALACIRAEDGSSIAVTRFSPADEGAKALFAIIGNSHALRMKVDATEQEGGILWQGSVAADNPDLEALTGPREVTATLPGAGKVTLHPSPRPAQLIAQCRAPLAPLPEPQSEEDANEAAPPVPPASLE